jgi:hypothetical protein
MNARPRAAFHRCTIYNNAQVMVLTKASWPDSIAASRLRRVPPEMLALSDAFTSFYRVRRVASRAGRQAGSHSQITFL